MMCLGYLSTAREGVLRVEYFKRLTTHASDDRRFKLVDERREFLVPSSMLSGGGASLPIALAQVSRARLELSRETCDAILAKLLISSLSLRTTLVICLNKVLFRTWRFWSQCGHDRLSQLL